MHSKFDYLRGRPFLVVELSSHPADSVHTERKGWHDNVGNVRIVDHPRIEQRISNNTMRRATIIIDLLNDCVIKNRHKSDATMFDDEVLESCKKKYADIIQSAKLRATL